MDTTTPATPHSPDLPAQIKQVTDRLTQVCLLEVAKKYRLPLEKLEFPLLSIGKGKFETDLYSLVITTDIHHAHIKWALKVDAIQKLATDTKATFSTWKFFGFIKEKPFSTRKLTSIEDLEDSADIITSTNGHLSFDLAQGVRYSGLFLVAFDGADTLMIDAETSTMIQRPPSPSLENISTLKLHLRELLEIQFSELPNNEGEGKSNSQDGHKENEFLAGVKKYAEVKKQLESIGLDEKKIEEFMDDFEEAFRSNLFKA